MSVITNIFGVVAQATGANAGIGEWLSGNIGYVIAAVIVLVGLAVGLGDLLRLSPKRVRDDLDPGHVASAPRRQVGRPEQVDVVAGGTQLAAAEVGDRAFQRAGERTAEGDAVHLVIAPQAAGEVGGDKGIPLTGEEGQRHAVSLPQGGRPVQSSFGYPRSTVFRP